MPPILPRPPKCPGPNSFPPNGPCARPKCLPGAGGWAGPGAGTTWGAGVGGVVVVEASVWAYATLRPIANTPAATAPATSGVRWRRPPAGEGGPTGGGPAGGGQPVEGPGEGRTGSLPCIGRPLRPRCG